MKLLIFLIFVTTLFSDTLDLKEGERLYKSACISCHGVNGNSQTDMQLLIKPRRKI